MIDNVRENEIETRRVTDRGRSKQPYTKPDLITYGSVRDLTGGGAGSGVDVGPPGMNMVSDRAVKDNIVEIGIHPLGFAIYLFDYKPEFRDAYGNGRRFGVMADEVEAVMPDAVSVHPRGHKQVNYARLGIDQTRQGETIRD